MIQKGNRTRKKHTDEGARFTFPTIPWLTGLFTIMMKFKQKKKSSEMLQRSIFKPGKIKVCDNRHEEDESDSTG